MTTSFTNPLTANEILPLMPYDPPMQFVDRIDEVDEKHIVATHTWTEKDPDVHLAAPFPITSESFRRKVMRDLTGRPRYLVDDQHQPMPELL